MLSDEVWFLLVVAIMYGAVLLALIFKTDRLEEELKELRGKNLAQ